jgi:hypothetical protein
MGGLATNDQYDEDDLLEELELMQREAAPEAAPVAAPVAAKAEVEPQAIVVGIDPALYPEAPRGKAEAKQSLLAADSAAETH